MDLIFSIILMLRFFMGRKDFLLSELSIIFVCQIFMCRFLVSFQSSPVCIFLVTNLTLIFPTLMYRLNVCSEMTLMSCFITTLLAWIPYTFMY